MRIEIGPTMHDRVIDLGARRDFRIADIGEAFRAQQLLGNVLRGAADRRLVQRGSAVVSKRSSAAGARGTLRTPAALAIDKVVRKWRRVCGVVIGSLPSC